MKKTYALAFASSLFLLGSCASDAPVLTENDQTIPDNGDGYYLRIELPSQVTTTRGEGDPYVTTVNNAAFVFFDVNGDYIATRRVGYTDPSKNNAGVIKFVDTHQNSNKCAVLQLSSVPYSVQCIINAPENHTPVIADLYNSTESAFYRSGSGSNYIVMSNSSYYAAEDQGADATGFTYATAIDPETNIYTDEQKATDANDATKQPVKIFVEPVCAKINVVNALESNTIANVDKTTDKDNNPVKEVEDKAVVSFSADYVFLTSYKTTGYTVKHLDGWNTYDDDLKSWGEGLNNEASCISGWVGPTPGSRTFAKWTNVTSNTATTYAPGSTGFAFPAKNGTKVFYPFENKGNNKAQYTSIVVAGKYSVTDSEGNDLAYSDTDKTADEAAGKTPEVPGTFYLVGTGKQFVICKNMDEVRKECSATADDTLVPDGVSAGDYSGWTGKLAWEGKSFLPKVIKYNGGYGYYTAAIDRVTFGTTHYRAIVRNTEYTLNIKGIAGMGVGLPSNDTPIVPTETPNPWDENSYLHIAVVVNPWVPATPQNVTWK